jgi:tetratricopeptide (TPR) repeat protein
MEEGAVVPKDTTFRRMLRQRHITVYEAFVAQFQRAARELADREGDLRLGSLTVSARQFDRWVGGELRGLPHPGACRVLEYMFGRSADKLFAELVSQDEAVRPAPVVASTTMTAPPAVHDDEDSVVEIVARTRQLTASNADDRTIAFLGSSLDGIVARYDREGPKPLRGQARSLRQLIHTLLDGHQPPRVRHELFRLAARAGGLLGYMAVNVGDFVLAETYATEALDLSRATEDVETELWARGTLSFGYYYAGRYRDADACATAAVDMAPSSAQAIRLLANGRARALGKMGDRKGVEQVVGRALELSAAHNVAAGLTPCISFEPYGYARTLANAVTAYVSAGQVGQVLATAERIDGLVEDSDPWSRSLVRLDVASALLQQARPDVERAMQLGREALAFCGDVPIRSVWQRSRDLYAQARGWQGLAAVGEYGEELRLWSSQPAALAMSRAGAL